MNLIPMVQQLREHKQKLDVAINVLATLAIDTPRRGRPPAYLKQLTASNQPVSKDGKPVGKPTKKYVRSAAVRKRMATAQKKRWAGAENRTSASAVAKSA